MNLGSTRPFLLLAFLTFILEGCTILAIRPVQPMADAAAAIRAAQEVGAATRTPTSTELYRKANDWFERAKTDFRLKNFNLAEQAANRARVYAESAEFESLRSGGKRANAGSGPSEAEVVQDPMSTPSFTSGPRPSGDSTPQDSAENPFSPESSPANEKLAPPTL